MIETNILTSSESTLLAAKPVNVEIDVHELQGVSAFVWPADVKKNGRTRARNDEQIYTRFNDWSVLD